MAVLFVTFLPKEDEETSPERRSDLQGVQLGNGQTLVSSGGIETNQIVITPADDGDGVDAVDDFSASSPLLFKPGSGSMKDLSKVSHTSQIGPGSRHTSESNLMNINVNQEKRAISNSSSIQGSQMLEIKKGDKVRFQVMPAAPDQPQETARDSGVETRGDKSDKDITDSDMVVERITLKEAVCEILTALSISNEVWVQTESGDQWRLEFVVESDQSEPVLNRLITFGIGRIPETSVSLFPANVHYEKHEESEKPVRPSEKSEFMRSIKSRLTVTQVVMAVQSNARLTFDFLTLIILASIIAGLGLAESSSVVLVASMLISPLMGPIIGFTFGIVIRNTSLWKESVRNELIGLGVCLSFGFLFGLLTGGINNGGAYWGSSDSWPTAEMQGSFSLLHLMITILCVLEYMIFNYRFTHRHSDTETGMLRSLWVGILIALPSGAGVALSILGGNTGSLVGVAISASLLPPAVNAGMLWGLAFITSISHPSYTDTSIPANNMTLGRCRMVNNNYNFVYSCDMPTEAAILGSVSLLLTILNIICIFFSAIAVLKLKEVAPHTALSEDTEAFWKQDIPVTRNAYKTVKGAASMDLAKQAKLLHAEIQEAASKTHTNFLQIMQNDRGIIGVTNRLPAHGIDFLKQFSEEADNERALVDVSKEEEQLIYNRYHTITNAKQAQQVLSRCTSCVSPSDKKSPFPSARGVGSVLRMRRPESVMSYEEGDVVLVDVEHLSSRSKRRPKSEYQRYISDDSVTTPKNTWSKSPAEQV